MKYRFHLLELRPNEREMSIYSLRSRSEIHGWTHFCYLRLIVYFRKHTYSLLELHISITESEQITNTQVYKYTTYKVAKEKQMENN